MNLDHQTVIPVSALNHMIRDVIESRIPLLWVSGEISNLTLASSGHYYFSLKDSQAQVRAVFFRHKAQYLDFKPSNGLQVEALASASLYEARGEFQLQIENLRPAGLGRLFEAFQKLKAKLEAEGLFDTALKRPLPSFPQTIGIVTSPAAAALRDVISTLARRWPQGKVVLYPTPVQGEGSGLSIAQTIETASARAEVDVLIVCRGGGSIEDLWAFNEEVVARAIAGCSMPVISGVGHETDFTIADFAADLRAPTPTAAAEHASPNIITWLQKVQNLRLQLDREIDRLLSKEEQRLDYLARRLLHPAERVTQQEESLQRLHIRLQRAMQQYTQRIDTKIQQQTERLWRRRPDLETRHARLDRAQRRLGLALQQRLARHEAALARVAGALPSLNPLAVLKRGYVLVESSQLRPITHVGNAKVGQAVKLIWQDGRADAIIQTIQTDFDAN